MLFALGAAALAGGVLAKATSKTPKAPDYGPVAEASAESARLAYRASQDQLAFAREQWDQQSAYIDQVLGVQLPILEQQGQLALQGADIYNRAMQQQMEVAAQNQELALQDRARYEQVFRPVEDALVQDALALDTEARRSWEAGRAQSDVARVQAAQEEGLRRQLQDFGIDPGSLRYQALNAGLDTQQAAQQAAAGNAARGLVEDKARALRGEAINIGRGLPAQTAAAYGLTLQGAGGAGSLAGNAQQLYNQTAGGVLNAAGQWQGAANAMGSPTAWQGLGNQATSQWGNTLNAGFGNQMTAFQNSFGQQAGNALMGIGAGALGTYSGMQLYGMAEGGPIDGPGGPKDDMVPIQASDGEWVVDADTVKWLGERHFKQLKDKAAKERQEFAAEQEQNQQQARSRQGLTLDEQGRVLDDPMYRAEGGPTYEYRRGDTFGYSTADSARNPSFVLGQRRRDMVQEDVRAAQRGMYSVPYFAQGVGHRNQFAAPTQVLPPPPPPPPAPAPVPAGAQPAQTPQRQPMVTPQKAWEAGYRGRPEDVQYANQWLTSYRSPYAREQYDLGRKAKEAEIQRGYGHAGGLYTWKDRSDGG